MSRYREEDDPEFVPYENEPAEPQLDDLDEETRSLVDRTVKDEVNRFKAAYGGRVRGALGALRAAGIDVDDTGRVAVQDQGRAAAFLGIQSQPAAREPAAREPARKEETPAAPEDPGPPPDATYEPEAFAAWVDKKVKQGLAAAAPPAATPQRDPQADAFQNRMLARELRDATTAARDLLPEFGLEEIGEDPRFDEAFQNGLRSLGIPIDQWDDPVALATVAGVVNAQLRRQPQRRSLVDELLEEDETPRKREPGSRSAERAAVSRASLAQIGASRSAGRPPRDAGQPNAKLQRQAELLGMDVRDVALAAKHTKMADYHEERRGRAAGRR